MQKQAIRHTLNGKWDFSFTLPERGKKITDTATVPGNAEFELQRLGLIDELCPPDRPDAMMPFEIIDDWTYSYTFDAPTAPAGWAQQLVFEGIDTIAEVYLNGEKLADCNNMHLTYRLPVEGKLQPTGNRLTVVIHSSELWAREHKRDMFSLAHARISQYDSQTHLRKARYQWGWDNAPRLLTHGIWRPVYLEYLPPCRFDHVYLYTRSITETQVALCFNWSYTTPEAYLGDHRLRYTFSYKGQPLYSAEKKIWFTQGNDFFSLPREQVKLWWPQGYGDPDLCHIEIEMLQNGQPVAKWASDWGVRTLRLERTEDILADGSGEFVFVVNGQRVYIRGTNWKPAHVLPALAEAKVERGLALARDLHCNMVRIWGGGFYEDHAFFDYCDRHGILVWQDFMLACEIPSLDPDYGRRVAAEAKQIIEKLRNHPSLAVWCGDNENDEAMMWAQEFSTLLPSQNRISRQILKEAVLRYDPYRSYVESSPFTSDLCFTQRCKKLPCTHFQPESHLYVTADKYFGELRALKSKFIGETGPIHMNAITANPAMFAREQARVERLWDQPRGLSLALHQDDGYFTIWRHFSREACLQYFGRDFAVEEFKDWTVAVNFLCSLIFKDAIELFRSKRWGKTGVIWWSLLDMWPMLFNYSVVDSDFCKKLPYFWIRNAQQTVALMAVRQELQGEMAVYLANDTLKERPLNYKVTAYAADGSTRLLVEGTVTAEPNSSCKLCAPAEADTPELWILEWQQEGKTYYNHAIAGPMQYDVATVRRWLKTIADLCGYADEILELK